MKALASFAEMDKCYFKVRGSNKYIYIRKEKYWDKQVDFREFLNSFHLYSNIKQWWYKLGNICLTEEGT